MATMDPRLEIIARQVIWWETPEIALSDQNDFLARVMARGFWDDLRYVEEVFGEDALRNALKNSKPGVIDIASWHYWHRRLGIEPIPGMPIRKFA
jgi:hypothetical protein